MSACMYVYVCKCAVKFLLKSRLKLSTKKRKERKKGKRKVRTIIQSGVYRTSYSIYRVTYFFVITIVFIRRNRSIASPFRIVLE